MLCRVAQCMHFVRIVSINNNNTKNNNLKLIDQILQHITMIPYVGVIVLMSLKNTI